MANILVPESDGYVYFISDGEGQVKIGCSRDVYTRLKELQIGNGGSHLKVIAVFCGYKKAEKALHRQFKHLHVRGEWFKQTAEIMDWIKSNANPSVSGIISHEDLERIRNSNKGVSIPDDPWLEFLHAEHSCDHTLTLSCAACRALLEAMEEFNKFIREYKGTATRPSSLFMNAFKANYEKLAYLLPKEDLYELGEAA